MSYLIENLLDVKASCRAYDSDGNLISENWWIAKPYSGTLIQRIKDAILVLQGKAEAVTFTQEHTIIK